MNPDQKPIRYAAKLAGVEEVTLAGDADAGYWRARLAEHHHGKLVPVEDAGRAKMLLIAAAGSFRGLRFQELSVSVLVRHIDDADAAEHAFLLGAFNSRRFFAFCERVFFSTPYQFAQVALALRPPQIRVVSHGKEVFLAERPSAEADETETNPGWSGWVYLPTTNRRDQSLRFHAEVTGNGIVIPFDHADDRIVIRPESAALSALTESEFRPRQWILRSNAKHAKSKTYPV